MILHEKFTLAQIAEALGKNPATLRTHINRSYVVAQGPRALKDDGKSDKPEGKHARFGFYTFMEFALAYRLEALGFQPVTAFKYAAQFAHGSGGGDVFDMPSREPGLPFHYSHGKTIFAVGCGRSWEDLWKPGEEYDTYGQIQRHLNCDDFVTVNASEVFDTVCGALRVHPYLALDAAYPEDAS